jgi:two-component system, response regulator
MTRRPGTVGGPGSAGREGQPLLPTILLVDADEDAGAMVRDAMLEGTGPFDLRTVASAAELQGYLAAHHDPAHPAPTLILVDLDVDDADAIDAIAHLKSDSSTRRIPVIALTRTRADERIERAYDAGANTVLPRPVTFLALVRLMKVFSAYWLEAAALPRRAA